MASTVSTLSPAEIEEVEAALGFGLSGSNLPSLMAPPRRTAAAKKTVITYTELLDLRANEVPLDGFYVRMTNGAVAGLVEAAKVAKWTGQGYVPAEGA